MGDVIPGPWKHLPQQSDFYLDAINALAGHLAKLVEYTHALEFRIQSLERERHKSNMSPDLP